MLREFVINNYELNFTIISSFFVNKNFNFKISFDHVKTTLDLYVKDISIFMRELLDYYYVKLV